MENDNGTIVPEIDHEYTDEIVCPYCGHEKSDSWDIVMNDECGVVDCGECGKEFEWIVHHSISYTTKKKEEV